MGAGKIDIKLYERTYFYWDRPIDYVVDNSHVLQIYPILLPDSEIFMSCAELLAVDKNGIADTDVISMSYLQFMSERLLVDETAILRFAMICKLCFRKQFTIDKDEYNRYRLISLEDNDDIVISAKKFDDIRTLILHQNLIDYDDDYTDPELKLALAETDKLRGQNIADISIERKMAIITSHTGISKQQQMEMSLRSHSVLFREVCGEVEFDNTWLVALYAGETKNLDHWIFRKKHGRLDGYIMSADDFAQSAGQNVK